MVSIYPYQKCLVHTPFDPPMNIPAPISPTQITPSLPPGVHKGPPGPHGLKTPFRIANGQRSSVKSVEEFYAEFDVFEDLGSGQFAVVRRCVNRSNGYGFAGKFIKKRRFNASRRGVRRSDIEREISILDSVGEHKNIIQLYDVYESPTEVILLLELVTGGELFDHVCARETLTEREATMFVRQILTAVGHLHDHHIVHLDLKPENVLLQEKTDGSAGTEIKLIDFGLSRRIGPEDVVRDMIGTPEFVAPEVVNYEPLSTATDMWALGVVTYILLSGVSPFLGHDREGTFANISTVTYDFDERFFQGTTDLAKDFIRRLFVREPKRRMTFRECLKHPWIRPPSFGTDPATVILLDQQEINVGHLRSFSIRRRWRSAVYAVILCHRLVKRYRSRHPPSVRDGGTPRVNGGPTMDIVQEEVTPAPIIEQNGLPKPSPRPQLNGRLLFDENSNNEELTISAIFCAVRERNLSGLEKLLSMVRINVNVQNALGETPLHIACASGYDDIAAALLSHRADPNVKTVGMEQTPLHYAATFGGPECVDTIVNMSTGPPTAGPFLEVDAKDATGSTPLHLAVTRAQVTSALTLLQAGCSNRLQNSAGDSALHIGARLNLIGLCDELCVLGCPVDLRNAAGDTALHVAARMGHCEVVRVLALRGADLDMGDASGQLPYDLATKEGWVKVSNLLDTIQDKGVRVKFAAQLKPGERPLRRIKLKLFGSSGTGKSQLLATLGNSKLQKRKTGSFASISSNSDSSDVTFKNFFAFPENPAYTRGVEVRNSVIPDCGEWSLWDFSGYDSYHLFYDHFVGNTDCIHAVTFNLTQPQEIQYAQVLYWLNFLHARVAVRTVGHCGKSANLAHVILLGTHADLAFLQKTPEGRFYSTEAEAMLKTLQIRFGNDLTLSMYLIDSRTKNSADFKGFKACLSELRSAIIERLPKTNDFSEQGLAFLDQIRSRQSQLPVLPWPTFTELLRQAVNPLAGEQHCQQLAQILQLLGEIVYVKGDGQDFDYVVCAPGWLGQDILGKLLSHEFLEASRVTGTYGLEEFGQVFPQVSDTIGLLQLLEALDLCACDDVIINGGDGESPEYEFPALISLDPPGSIWTGEELQDFVYGGVRLQAPREHDHQMGGIFPRLQVHLRRALTDLADSTDCDLAQWRGCSTLCSSNTEAVVRLYKKDQGVEVIVRGPAFKRSSCFYLMQDLISIVEQTLATIAPSLPVERHFLSPQCIRARSNTPVAYAPRAFIDMQISQKTVLTGSSGEQEMEESFIDVVCFGQKDIALTLTLGMDLPVSHLPPHARRELAALLDPCDPMGRDWSILGASLGLNDSLKEVDAAKSVSKTDQILSEWLLSVVPNTATIRILYEKLETMGRKDAVEVLLRTVPPYLVASLVESEAIGELSDFEAKRNDDVSSDWDRSEVSGEFLSG